MTDSQSNAKFQFYINRQGPKGNQGPKGDTGFSPSIEVDTNTAAEYKLKIINEDNEIVTDNLRGSAVEDFGGTYMRYDRETQAMYAGTPDSATDISAGVVRIANEEDIERMSSDGVVNAGQVADALHVYLKSSDGSVVITQDNEDFKTNLSVDFSGVSGDISGLNTRVTDLESSMDTAEDRLDSIEHNAEVDEQAISNNTIAIGNIQTTLANKVDKVAGKGLSTNDFTDAEEEKLMHAVVDEDLANVAFTGDYNDLTNKPSIPSVTNMMTVDTTQSVTGPKTFEGNTLNVGNSQGGVGSVAHYDTTIYPTTETNVNRAAGVVLGSLSTTDLNTLASQWMFEYDDDIQGYRHAQIFNDFNLIGGTNVSIIKNATTGKHEVVAHDTIYSASNGIDINNANQISVKVDGNSIIINSDGELEAVGGGSGGAMIDDTQASSSTVYSSNKTDAQIISATTALAQTVEDTFLTQTDASTTYASLGGSNTFAARQFFNSDIVTGTVLHILNNSYRTLIVGSSDGTNDYVYVGNNTELLGLRGSATRPTYNNNDLALYSDIADAASTYVSSTDIRNIVKITETAYNNLQNPDANTFYVVVPDPSV